VRGRIESILAAATVTGLRSGDNPARWRHHLDQLLPARRKVRAVRHHPALPYREMPAFMARLRRQSGTAARALEFAILTAARSGEVRGATLAEVERDAALWTISAERMKGARTHRVPLSPAALALVDGPGPLLFPGARRGRPLSDMALTEVLRRMGCDAVPHGFRSSFRDWSAEVARAPREVAEAAPAHQLGGVEGAYQRGDMLERRADAGVGRIFMWCYRIEIRLR
jgi:integrase